VVKASSWPTFQKLNPIPITFSSPHRQQKRRICWTFGDRRHYLSLDVMVLVVSRCTQSKSTDALTKQTNLSTNPLRGIFSWNNRTSLGYNYRSQCMQSYELSNEQDQWINHPVIIDTRSRSKARIIFTIHCQSITPSSP
jgi:hypothetical protein